MALYSSMVSLRFLRRGQRLAAIVAFNPAAPEQFSIISYLNLVGAEDISSRWNATEFDYNSSDRPSILLVLYASYAFTLLSDDVLHIFPRAPDSISCRFDCLVILFVLCHCS